MDDHEVKYIPTRESSHFPFKCKEWVQLKNRRSNNQLSVFISVLSLIVALCFFTLLFTWLWGVPEKVSQNEEKISALEDVVQNNQEVYNAGTEEKKQFKAICVQQKDAGSCFASMPRWYFDKDLKICKQFEYSGCNGNQNNFHTEDSCLSACSHSQIGFKDRSIKVDLKGKFIILT